MLNPVKILCKVEGRGGGGGGVEMIHVLVQDKNLEKKSSWLVSYI